MQAQDVSAYPLALRARIPGLTAADVAMALADKSVVRTWGPRGTIHLIAADDVAWLVPLVRSSPTASLRRLKQLGAPISHEDAVAAADSALAGAGPLTKVELGERLRRTTGNEAIDGQAIVHLAMLAAREGLAVLGPERAGKPTYVHAADWLGAPIPMAQDRDDALAELAVRYLRARPYAGPEDLAAWSGLPIGEVRKHVPPAPNIPVAQPDSIPVRMLPAFDEYLLGWRDRSWAVPAELATTVHPGGGVLRAVLLVDGRATGVWRRSGRAIVIDPPTSGAAEIDAESADVAAFIAG